MIHLDCVKTHVTVGKLNVRLCACYLEQNARGAGRPLLESRLGYPFEFRGRGVTSSLSDFPPCLLPQQLRWGWGKVRKTKVCYQTPKTNQVYIQNENQPSFLFSRIEGQCYLLPSPSRVSFFLNLNLLSPTPNCLQS